MVLRTKSWRIPNRCCAIALMIACAIPESAFAQEPERKAQLESILKDWQYRQSVLKSARYVVTGTTEYKDRQLPPGNPLRPRRSVLLLDLMKKRYRLEGSEEIIYVNGKDNDPSQWDYRPRSSTSAYDGKALQSYRHKEANRLNDDL